MPAPKHNKNYAKIELNNYFSIKFRQTLFGNCIVRRQKAKIKSSVDFSKSRANNLPTLYKILYIYLHDMKKSAINNCVI